MSIADESAPAAVEDAQSEVQAALLPSIDKLLQPVLEAVADGQARESSEVVTIVSDSLGLDAEGREARIRSGRTVIENRVGWACTSLTRAGLLEQPRESAVAITDVGRSTLEIADGPIDHLYLRRACPGYANWLADMGGELPDDELDGSAK